MTGDGTDPFDGLVDRVPVPMLQLEADGSIAAVNDALTDLVGWSEVELLGEPAAFVSDRSLDDWQALLATASRGEEPDPETMELRTATGVSLRVRVTALPASDDGADVDADAVTVVMEDVTDEWERECELELLRRVLRHNIRNRVNVVQGYAEQFAEIVEGDVAAAKLDDLVEATDAIARASDKATDLRRVFDADRELVPVDVTRTVESAATHVRDRFPAANVTVSTPESAHVNALPVIELAIQNLVTNAVEHNEHAEPTVDVTVSTTYEMGHGNVVIEIADDGPKIPEMELQTLQRGEEDSLNHSSGLGLWIAQWVVARSNGKLVYEETTTEGNAIKILLPKTPGTPDESL